jgi:cysteine sulfinate desulfinase/cysteine desulfurase-like protein
MLRYYEDFGNASSAPPWASRTAAIDDARDCAWRSCWEPRPRRCFAGGTEANNTILSGWVAARRARLHLVISAIEHPCVLDTCASGSTRLCHYVCGRVPMALLILKPGRCVTEETIPCRSARQ